MIRRIIETTDDKFIGQFFDDESFTLSDGSDFKYTLVQHLDSGLIRYSNSNYVVLTEEIS
jgi:hypothetical protein